MQNSIFIGLVQNIAVLLAFSMIYDYFWAKEENIKTITGKIFAGLFIGFVAILLMMIPWTLSPGLQFDSRSILLAVSGLFFGGIPTAIAMLIAGLYRIYLGGSGMWMGVAVVLSSGFIGIMWGQFFPPVKIRQPHFNILFMGLIVHIMMMLCTFFLPRESVFSTMRVLILPLLLLYTPGTMLLGLIMIKRWAFWQQQKMIAEEEVRYRQLFENAGEAIVVAQNGYIRFANDRLSILLGVPYKELKDKLFADFIHPDDQSLVLQRHSDRLKKKNIPKTYSFRIINSTGETRWIEINSTYFEWEGAPSSLNFITDITSMREASRQLVIAKNKAEESDRLKSVFLANLSHEVRTPMNAILGFSELLDSPEVESERKHHYIDMIRAAGKQLMHIINDIVDISKLEVNQLSINKKNTNLFEIFEQSADVFKNSDILKEKKNIDLILEYPEVCRDIRVLTDPYRLRQVMDNLLGNAIKYTEYGTITIRCIPEISGNQLTLETHVIDTGAGIPEDKKEIIFDRFRQVEEDRYREGAGIGLSITKGIIELLGGTVDVESQKNKGSDFYFTLPLEIVNEPASDQPQSESRIPDLKGKTVIIAEDNRTSYYLIKEYLAETRADILYAEDGDVLVNMLAKKVPDLILLDINMPKRDGYECLDVIREKGYECKVIAQTAYAMENEKERCLNSGCQGYVSKPIDPDFLYREISKVMNIK